MYSLSLQNISRRFATRDALTNVNVEARTGDTMVVTGPNGSGKSTLLKIMAGALSPTNGSMKIMHEDVELTEEQRRHITGFVSPDLIMYSGMSGVENLLFFAELRGIKPKHEDLKNLLEMVGLLGRGRDMVSAYSSGMRQRLKYAFALLHRPSVLLLDEPTANLDSAGLEMVNRVVAMQREHGLLVVATNDAHEAQWGNVLVRLGD